MLGVVQRLDDGLDRQRPVGRDRRRDLTRLVEGVTVGHDVADQPDLLGLWRQDVLAGQQDVGRHRVRNLALEAYGRAAHRVERPAGLRDAEPGALPGDADVGALQDLRATGDGDALDRGDDGFGGSVGLEQAAIDESRIVLEAGFLVDGAVGIDVAGHGPQVHARGEVALRPGEDGAPQVVILSQLVPRVRQQGEHRERHRVLPFRAVHGDDQYVVVTFDVDLGHLRRFAPIMELVPHVSTLWPLSWGG